MRIENLPGDGSWHKSSIPPDGNIYWLRAKNANNVINVTMRFANNPSETYIFFQSNVGPANWMFVNPKQTGQIEFMSSGNTIQVFYSKRRR